jgi:hypothetical protein
MALSNSVNPKMGTMNSFYTIIADEYVYEGSQQSKAANRNKLGFFPELTTNTTKFPVIIDSGTNLNYLPGGELTFVH